MVRTGTISANCLCPGPSCPLRSSQTAVTVPRALPAPPFPFGTSTWAAMSYNGPRRQRGCQPGCHDGPGQHSRGVPTRQGPEPYLLTAWCVWPKDVPAIRRSCTAQSQRGSEGTRGPLTDPAGKHSAGSVPPFSFRFTVEGVGGSSTSAPNPWFGGLTPQP